MKRAPYILLVVFLCSVELLTAQAGKHYEMADGDEHFNHRNYTMALPIYKEILKKDKDNKDLQYKIAQCYLFTYFNKPEAIKYLEFCTKDEKYNIEAWLLLGQAYRIANRLDDAIKAFTKYKEKDPKKKAEADRQIEICSNAKKLMQAPINVSFTNLGKDINSEFADYYPWINKDESFLAFTTRRKGVSAARVEMDGYYASDVYTSQIENGRWAKAANAGNKINTSLDEQVVGLKADGSEMYIYIDHIDKFGDIYVSTKKFDAYQKIVPLPEIVNSKFEHAASVSADGNTLFFVRQEDNNSSTDIFMLRKLPNGSWSTPQKLSNEINTPYNEDFPYLSIDGKTLFFSSQGHNTMGGFDLFKSTWDAETNAWTPAENLGYPVNTTDDDHSISLTPDNRVGYISALRPGGNGDLDIYRIKFNDVDQKLTLYLGQVVLGDSLNKPKEYNVTITAVNDANQEEFSFVPNRDNGRLVMALPAGTYTVTISSDGYADVSDKISVSDMGSPIAEEKKNYTLLKK